MQGTIRSATRKDVPRIVELIRETIIKVNSKDYGPEMTQRYLDWVTQENLYKEIESKTDYIVYEEEGQVLGVAGIDREKAYMRRGFVDHHHRGKGIGTRLIEALETRARERGEEEVMMHATITSLEYLKRRGFVREGKEDHDGFIIYPMRKSLTQKNLKHTAIPDANQEGCG